MKRDQTSFTIVINGDWNQLYIQPTWLAQNVFEHDTVEIGISEISSFAKLVCQFNGVVIKASQNQVVFSIIDCSESTITYLCKVVNNFLSKSYTTGIVSYGMNSDYHGDEQDMLNVSKIIDSMGDRKNLSENGYTILSTNISERIKIEDYFFNIEHLFDNNSLRIKINEHHGEVKEKTNYPSFTPEMINTHFDQCNSIITAIGYEVCEE